jgi:predicted esterase YcpF (UPF0227 family)
MRNFCKTHKVKEYNVMHSSRIIYRGSPPKPYKSLSLHWLDEHPSNQWSEVEGIDREDIDMSEDMTVDVVQRKHEGVMLARHWIGDGADRYQRAHQKWDELAKSGWSEGHTTFAS